MKTFYLLPLLFLTACGSQMSARESYSQANAMEELKIALMDIRSAHGAQQMEIELLQEKLAFQKGSVSTAATSQALEQRMSQLESMQDKICKDLAELQSHANLMASLLQEYKNHIYSLDKNIKQQEQKIGQVAELKSTLKSVSKALRTGAPSGKTHTVKAGDTLGKIAYDHHVSLDALKKANGLKSSTILIGQELTIPE